MKRKVFVSILLLALAFSAIGIQAFAADPPQNPPYRVRLFAGNSDVGVLTESQDKEVGYGDPYTFDASKVDIVGDGDDERYYVKGFREAGKDNSNGLYVDTYNSVEHDMDFVVAYGMKGSAVEYTVNFVDANGAFCPDDAMKKLNQLSRYDLHSIEQPIRAGQWQQMSWLCRNSPVPIALDEELIGANDSETRRELLHEIRPSYIVLKPSLHGGISGCNDWISQSKGLGIESWITSALESNIGLSAIAQYCSWVYGSGFSMPQGLGTGMLYSDNTPSTTEVRGNKLWYVEC